MIDLHNPAVWLIICLVGLAILVLGIIAGLREDEDCLPNFLVFVLIWALSIGCLITLGLTIARCLQ